MTILQRAATIAAMTFSLAGLLGHSTPGKATELDRTAITTPVSVSYNTLAPANVPQIVPAVTPVFEPAVTPAPIAPAEAESEDFDSLAEAVAAQDSAAANESLQCLAGAVYFESKGEPLAGQLAVAEVIINRAKSGRFPADVCDVVTQRGQFSFVRGGHIPTITAGKAYRTAIAVAKVALASAWNSPAPKALFFNTPNRSPGGRLTKIAAIGNHIFYR
ncbi:cell wall hydrolase [Sphingomonas ginsenosidivorax]|uniref:Cell wall hydrolase n=1 Tax=Sphingomonas ginsenosidivorax TaxID=862135 RepID=A0A5C6UJM5_9SPHN|nr:cell wall hydrolase [Sphingomonas ginsenosidivorax]TXC72255.1 cell wall hydrolase [Sphingomonas ginsenosidivorax]